MEQETVENNRNNCTISGYRHVVVFLAFAGTVYSFAIRVAFSVALVAMMNSTEPLTLDSRNNSCNGSQSLDLQNKSLTQCRTNADNTSVPDSGKGFNWDLKTQSFMLSALFYGALTSQMIGGVITQRFGIKWVLGVTGLLSSILALLTPVATSSDATPVIVIRFIQGVLEGPLYSSKSQLVSFWSPIMERSRAFSILGISNNAGIIIGMLVSGVLVESTLFGGWPSVFYVFGIFGSAWSLFWLILVTDEPQENSHVSQKELEIIQKGKQNNDSKVTNVPWKNIFMSAPAYAFIIAVAANYVGTMLLMTELPIYLSRVFNFNIKASSALSATPFIIKSLMTFLSGYVADALRRRGKFSITTIRKMMTLVGFVGAGLLLLAIVFSGHQMVLIIILLCISCGITGVLFSGANVAAVDMCPRFSGLLMGIATTVGSGATAVMPYFVAVLTSSGETVENWSKVFIILAVILIVSGLQFAVLGSAEHQPWDSPTLEDKTGITNPAFENTNSISEVTKL